MLLSKWRALADAGPLRRLGRDSLVASATALVARGMGFAKEVVVAAFYGLADSLDVYVVAVVLVGFPLAILLNAAQTGLVAAVAGGSRSKMETWRLFSGITLVTLAAIGLVLPLWLLALPSLFPWLAAGFPAAKQVNLFTAIVWLVPYYFLNAFNLLAYGILQAHRHYLANGLIPLATPVVTIAVVVVSGSFEQWEPLAAALVLGTFVESVVLVGLLRRSGCFPERTQRQTFSPRALVQDPGVRAVVISSILLVPATLMLAIGPVIEQAIAANLGDGTNAAVSYGYKLPTALISISATAIGITALPYFAGQLAHRQYAYCLHSLDTLARWILVAGLAMAIPLIAASHEIVRLLYERGAFDATAVKRVAPVQLAYFVQIPFAILAMLATKTLSALGRNGLVSLFTAAVVILQIALAYSLAGRIGAAGIAWAAATGSALLAVVSFASARATIHRLMG